MTFSYSKVNDILQGCKLSKQFNKQISTGILPGDDDPDCFSDELDNFISVVAINSASVEHASLNKLMALSCLSVRFLIN